MPVATLRTERLVLRPWREEDLDPFAELNADPEVMRFFPRPMDRAASDAFAARIRAQLDEHGWGLWAAELVGTAPFIGFIGLAVPPFEAHFSPAVEVGWRLARTFWGRGYAPEGAAEALRFGFTELGLDEIVSMTIPTNLPSQRVMQKLGMTHDPADDFDLPTRPADDPMRRTVLYRLGRDDWAAGRPH